MKKLFAFAFLCAFVAGYAGMAFAGGRNMNPNQSAEYCKTLNRFASIDPDAAYFNPAGTALMADGLYVYISNQFV